MYTNNATRKHPGLVVLMIDQSGSMEDTSLASGKTHAVIASEYINIFITEMVYIATRLVGDDDEEVRDFQKVVICGYGSEPENKATILYEGYLSDIANKYKKEEKIATINGQSLWGYRVIEPISGYFTPMASAFNLVKQQINKWKAEGKDGIEDPSPIIINITDGAPTDEEGYPTEEALAETAKEAREIMNISFPDGSPRIFNILISKLAENEVYFPDNTNVLEGDSFAQFLYSISSTMTDDLMEAISSQGLGKPTANSRMLLMGETSIDKFLPLLIDMRRNHWRGKLR